MFVEGDINLNLSANLLEEFDSEVLDFYKFVARTIQSRLKILAQDSAIPSMDVMMTVVKDYIPNSDYEEFFSSVSNLHSFNQLDNNKIVTPLNLLDIAPNKRLLITGESGAGKTFLLWRLANELTKYDQFEKFPKIPLYINVSRFKTSFQQELRKPFQTGFFRKAKLTEETFFTDWLFAEAQKFHGNISAQVLKKWAKEGRFIYLIDGFDEIESRSQPLFIKNINSLIEKSESNVSMILCSRESTIKKVLPLKLNFGLSVRLETLSEDEIDAYLEKGGEDLVGLRSVLSNLSHFDKLDENERHLVQTPFMLTIMSATYFGRSEDSILEVLDDADSYKEFQYTVFDEYVRKSLDHKGSKGKDFDDEETVHYLEQIAKGMNIDSSSIFLANTIQPNWLLNYPKQKKLYRRGMLLPIDIFLSVFLVINIHAIFSAVSINYSYVTWGITLAMIVVLMVMIRWYLSIDVNSNIHKLRNNPLWYDASTEGFKERERTISEIERTFSQKNKTFTPESIAPSSNAFTFLRRIHLQKNARTRANKIVFPHSVKFSPKSLLDFPFMELLGNILATFIIFVMFATPILYFVLNPLLNTLIPIEVTWKDALGLASRGGVFLGITNFIYTFINYVMNKPNPNLKENVSFSQSMNHTLLLGVRTFPIAFILYTSVLYLLAYIAIEQNNVILKVTNYVGVTPISGLDGIEFSLYLWRFGLLFAIIHIVFGANQLDLLKHHSVKRRLQSLNLIPKKLTSFIQYTDTRTIFTQVNGYCIFPHKSIQDYFSEGSVFERVFSKTNPFESAIYGERMLSPERKKYISEFIKLGLYYVSVGEEEKAYDLQNNLDLLDPYYETDFDKVGNEMAVELNLIEAS